MVHEPLSLDVLVAWYTDSEWIISRKVRAENVCCRGYYGSVSMCWKAGTSVQSLLPVTLTVRNAETADLGFYIIHKKYDDYDAEGPNDPILR